MLFGSDKLFLLCYVMLQLLSNVRELEDMMEKDWRGVWFCGWDQQMSFLEALKNYPTCHCAKPLVWCKKTSHFKDISVPSGSVWNQNCEYAVWAVFGDAREPDSRGELRFKKLEGSHFPFGLTDLPAVEKTRLRAQCFAARSLMETEKLKVKQQFMRKDNSGLETRLVHANPFEKGPWLAEHVVRIPCVRV